MKQLFVIGALLCAVVAHAKTVVPVIWPFSISSTNATMVREIINSANNQQDKYQFIFESKPGAGGAVAVHYAASLDRPAILAHSSSFFIRPYIIKEGTYNVDQFNIINVHCTGQPLALISTKYTNLRDIQNQNNLTVGVLPGSITETVVVKLNTKSDHKLQTIPFRGTPEITASLLGGHIDLGIEFLSGVSNPRLNVIGITGNKNYNNFTTFQLQKMTGLESIVVDFFLLVNQNLQPDIAQDFNTIFSTAVDSVRPRAYCQRDFGTYTNITGKSAQQYFNTTHNFWKRTVEATKK
jgi:tripartite-type tricarboxylate transporter receptor subunit TctC